MIIDGNAYKIFGDGSVADPSGKIILPSGGAEALKKWIEDRKPKFKLFPLGGKQWKVWDDGRITDLDDKLICTGKPGETVCLEEYLKSLEPKVDPMA